jgi:prepilin-type N-terminal cleavage/methylation domain-containing protein
VSGYVRRTLRTEHGFSLLEVLVASTLLSVALLSLAQLLALATAANASAGRATYAAVLAAEQLEQLRSLSWESLRGRAGDSVDELDRSGALLAPGSPGMYRRRLRIEPLPSDPANALVIQVIVTGRGEVARMATIRARTAQ